MNDLQPRKRKKSRLGRLSFIVVLALAVFVYIRYYYVFGSGVKSGELNYLVYKGVVFKTYEGKLIQTGYRADRPGGLQSNQFEFSIANKELAEKLMLQTGKNVQLHYKEYFAPIHWRGYTKFIVDSIIAVEEPAPYDRSSVTPYILDNL